MPEPRKDGIEVARKALQHRLRIALAEAGFGTLPAVQHALIGRAGIFDHQKQTIRRCYSGNLSSRDTDSSRRVLNAMAALTREEASLIEAVEEFWKLGRSLEEQSTNRSARLIRDRWFQVILPQQDRNYASIDVVDVDWQDGDMLEGRIERVSPRQEGHLRWEFKGTTYADAVFLAFWPSGDRPDHRSRGTISLGLVGDRGKERFDGWYMRLAERTNDLLNRSISWRASAAEIPQQALQRIAVLDFDNSLHRGWSLRAWLGFLARHGWDNAERACKRMDRLVADYRQRKFGHDQLSEKCARAYANVLRGHTAVEVDAAARQYVRQAAKLEPFAPAIIRQLLDMQIAPVIVSGAPKELLRHYSEQLGVSEYHALTLKVDDAGHYTGGVADNLARADAKEQLLAELQTNRHRELVLAVGDSDSDLPALDAAPARIIVGDDLSERQHWDPKTSKRLVHDDIDISKLIAWIRENVECGN